MYELKECSPQAAKKLPENVEHKDDVYTVEHQCLKYPFQQMKIGQCFTVSINEAKEASLRVLATKNGKMTSKKFSVLRHEELGIFEIARVG